MLFRSLGQVLKPTKDYTVTGDSADAYKYLMGQANWKAPAFVKPEQKNTKYLITDDGRIVPNPNYNPSGTTGTTTTAGGTTTGLSARLPNESGPDYAKRVLGYNYDTPNLTSAQKTALHDLDYGDSSGGSSYAKRGGLMNAYAAGGKIGRAHV